MVSVDNILNFWIFLSSVVDPIFFSDLDPALTLILDPNPAYPKKNIRLNNISTGIQY